MTRNHQDIPTLSIIGGGQLGRMLGLSAATMGIKCRFYDSDLKAPAGVCGPVTHGSFDDLAALKAFVDAAPKLSRSVTCEFENIPAEALASLESEADVAPPAEAFRVAQDRLLEKGFFNKMGIATASFRSVDSLSELELAAESLTLPAVLKTRRFGYDGKGQVVIKKKAELKPAWESLGGKDLILEGFVAFERELSIISVRSRSGQLAFYPLIENQHRNGILRSSMAPAVAMASPLQRRAEEIATAALEKLSYVGVLVIEFFQTNETLIVNEMAPRVHNSGHLTIEAAETSQFENHLRAVMGWPLGSTRMREPAAMLNVIGTWPDPTEILRHEGAHLHLYGKEPRPGRKLGHITVTAPTAGDLQARMKALEELIP